MEYIAEQRSVSDTEFLEKDYLIHRILYMLSSETNFRDNFAFKGGTALIKGYLGYYRFSEDMDFTWIHQNIFENMTQKEIRTFLSREIDRLGDLFSEIAGKTGMDFQCNKQNSKYIEFGGSNKMCTFKLWYTSEAIGRTTFVKVQFNFVELLKYEVAEQRLSGFIGDKISERIRAIFPEEARMYSTPIVLNTYDIREILCEKARAVLTRRALKFRDYIDIYMISDRYDMEVEDYTNEIIQKVRFSLTLYNKYRENLSMKKNYLTQNENADFGEERGLLLIEPDWGAIYRKKEKINDSLLSIMENLYG